MKININQKRFFVFLFILAILIISITPIIRSISNKPLLIGEKPYHDIRMSQAILEKGLNFKDPLVFENKEYSAQPYHLLLIPFIYFLKPNLTFLFFTYFTGILSLLLFFLVLKEFKIKRKQTILTLLIFILSPAFIYSSGTLNEFGLSICLLLLGTLLFLKEKFFKTTIFIFLIATILNLFNALVIIFLLLFLSEIDPTKKRNINLTIAYILLTTFIYYIYNFFNINLLKLLTKGSLMHFVSDLGGPIGLSVFTLILGIIGIFITWDHKQQLKNIYYLILLLIIASLYFEHANIYLNIIFSIFAGIAITKIIYMKWDVKGLKTLTTLLLLCGLLFSTISYIERFSVSEPSKELKESLEWFNKNAEKGIIFSHHSKGYWITYFADNQVLTDSTFFYENPTQKIADSSLLFNSQNIKEIKTILDKYSIKYIFIDPKMKKGQVWTKKQGLWYSFRNSETFNNLYNKDQIEIWEYIG